ncbi:hypothetical protein [Dactylosporangium sp. NPDC006015]|uniref:hypothetical protein n=1 Tax=Dactylosporangium sp. NPDC006015 TaxID=3154576 RepID=UPI0033B1613C
MTTNLVDCPECGLPATVRGDGPARSTGGPVEHIRLHCVLGHRFFGPVTTLRRPPGAA